MTKRRGDISKSERKEFTVVNILNRKSKKEDLEI